MRIAIIAAMPGELKPLVRGWRRERGAQRGIRMWTRDTGDDVHIAVCAGMGTEAVVRSFAEAESRGRIDIVLSAGWGGALEAQKKPGHCYAPSEVIDAQTGERFSLMSGDGKLVTTPRVANAVEKNRLRQTYGASLVDMEAATVARLARMRDIPFFCFKAVSDGIDEKLPDLNSFIDNRGQLRLSSFLAYAAVRPLYWAALLRLGRNSDRAAKALAAGIEEFLQTKNVEGINRTGAA